jgi:hypothetical protein
VNQAETVVEAIRTQLEDQVVGGGTYEYPPDPRGVMRLLFMPEAWVPDPTFDTAYYVWHESEQSALGRESCTITGSMQMAVRACHRLQVASENPNEQEPLRSQVALAMAADVRQALYSDFTFGGTARQIAGGGAIAADYQVFEASTAIVDLRFTVEYTTPRPGR